MKQTLFYQLCVIVLAICFPNCTGKEASLPKPQIDHVVLIGFDGWGAYSIPKANMPNAKGMIEKGASTFSARSVLPSSSAVNWASMMMGAGPELHGFTTWGSQKPDLPSRILTEEYGMFPSIFGLLRQQKPEAKIGYFYEWEGMKYLMEEKAADVAIHAPADSLNIDNCIEAAEKFIREEKPTFTMIALDQPDGVGHGAGHDTPEYYTELERLDKYIARIVQATKDAGIYDNTLFILTADHGGIEKGHGGKTMQEMEIPMIFFGKGVKAGYKIEESVMIFDMASTLAYAFNLQQPQVWIGRPIISIFK